MGADYVPLVDTHAHVYTLDMPLSGSAWHKPPNEAPVAAYLDTVPGSTGGSPTAATGIGGTVLPAAAINYAPKTNDPTDITMF